MGGVRNGLGRGSEVVTARSAFLARLAFLFEAAGRDVVKADEVDVLASTMLSDFEEVEYAEEAGGLGERGRDVGQADGFDGVDLDLAFFHAVAATDANLQTHPDTDGAGDFAGADAFAEALGEVHGGRIPGSDGAAPRMTLSGRA